MKRTVQAAWLVLAVGVVNAPVVPAQAPPPREQREYLASVQEATRLLVSEVEEIQDHFIDMRDARGQELHQRAEEVLQSAWRFQDTLKANPARERLYRAFTDLDRELYELVAGVKPHTKTSRALARDLASLSQADERLHYTLSQGDPNAERALEVIHRQVHALADEAEDLHRVAHSLLANDRRAEHTMESVEAFAKAAEHLHESIDKGATRDHVRRDFAAVDREWHHLAKHVNELPPRQYSFLRAKAQRLDAIHERLFKLLALEGDRPGIVIRLDGQRP